MAHKVHVGFKSAAESISKREGVSIKTADRELASATRHASAHAKMANPRLKKVRG